MESEKVIRRELELFIRKQIPGASLSSIDDVILGYLVDVLSTLGEEDSSFDVDQFVEMMTAYIPDISSVDSTVLCEWIFQLASMQQAVTDTGNEALQTDCIDRSADNENDTSQTHNLQTVRGGLSGSCDDREGSNGLSGGDRTGLSGQLGPKDESLRYPDSERVELLAEMFPEVPGDQLHQTLLTSSGDMDTAIQLLLDQPVGAGGGPAGCTGKPAEEHRSSASPQDEEEKAHLKDFVLSRYAYVPMDEDEKLHCPSMPKMDSKKMVRYRDNQVVSTKGERFTVLTKKDLEPDGMKKTYINLKPLRKYRFH